MRIYRANCIVRTITVPAPARVEYFTYEYIYLIPGIRYIEGTYFLGPRHCYTKMTSRTVRYVRYYQPSGSVDVQVASTYCTKCHAAHVPFNPSQCGWGDGQPTCCTCGCTIRVQQAQTTTIWGVRATTVKAIVDLLLHGTLSTAVIKSAVGASTRVACPHRTLFRFIHRERDLWPHNEQ